MLIKTGRAALAAALILTLAACGRDGPDDKIAGRHDAPARNSQEHARALFDGLCAARSLPDARCSCMRERMLRAGTAAMAFTGATYGGNLEEAAATAAQLDEDAQSAAIDAYFDAEMICAQTVADPALAAGAPLPAAPTLADVGASCRPAMAEVCQCRARALAGALNGDTAGAYQAAIAMNTGDRAMLARLGEEREAGWADFAADSYARTSAPCIVQAGGR